MNTRCGPLTVRETARSIPARIDHRHRASRTGERRRWSYLAPYEVGGVPDRDEDNEHDQHRESGEIDQRLTLRGKPASPDGLDESHQDAAPVEGRKGEHVEHREVDREDAHEDQLADPRRAHHATRLFGDP